VSEAERAQIQAEVAMNVAQLGLDDQISALSAETVSFAWPLRPAAHLTDYGYHGVSGFVDHNPATGARQDYMCGDRTYDLTSGYDHQGTDFFTYPYPWLKMDESSVEIVAAAPGTIVFKRDGQYDRQCEMTGDYSNAVVISHADGTVAYYLHMKEGSLTSKAVGETVVTGEYLGVVGSSGSSTGPHLHFEVRSASNQVLDPYEGPCNVVASMWTEQPDYYDSRVIAVHTGDAAPVRPPCPGTESPNIEDIFQPEDTIYFVTYYRDQLAEQQSLYRILRPDGTVYEQWPYASTREHYSASYWYWAKTVDGDNTTPLGTWRFEVIYEGETYQTTFSIGTPTPITVTLPNGGEAWAPGSFQAITWQDSVPRDIDIDLYAGGSFHSQIKASEPSTGGVTFWRVPADTAPRTDYQIRISDSSSPGLFDMSDGVFTIAQSPTASFAWAPVLGPAPLTVSFTDTSTSMVEAWGWNFGDGTTTTLQNPTHTYASVGAYTVTLSVGGPAGADVLTQTHAVTVTPPPLDADFSATPRMGTPPLTVAFSDQSTGPPVQSWLWSFGDGLTSTQQQPNHVYQQTGAYTVTLTAGAGDEQDLEIKPRYVLVVDDVSRVFLPVVTR
jgi:PKD repeat protein/murein DD-endopeptidase MepM/ murein hydrolase activator NlpD